MDPKALSAKAADCSKSADSPEDHKDAAQAHMKAAEAHGTETDKGKKHLFKAAEHKKKANGKAPDAMKAWIGEKLKG